MTDDGAVVVRGGSPRPGGSGPAPEAEGDGDDAAAAAPPPPPPPPPPPSSAGASSTSPPSAAASASASASAARVGVGVGSVSAPQAQRLRDANAKYKNLLKLAKERIQSQEEELERLRVEGRRSREELAAERARSSELAGRPAPNGGGVGGGGGGGGSEGDEDGCRVVRVYQRVRADTDEDDDAPDETDSSPPPSSSSSSPSSGAIWALVGYESNPPDDVGPPPPPSSSNGRARRFCEWRRFAAESDLSDHVRRSSGEPVSLPPYSLTPAQSARIEDEARRSVERVTEEFRRFRVRAEVARKQADATVRALHGSNVAAARRRIEGQDVEAALEQARTDHAQLSRLRSEMSEQESRWRDAYDALLAENAQLKSSGAEALLAAQWRRRYEQCLGEKEDAEARLGVERERSAALAESRNRADAGKYESKYRDLKESFRLYRKKAKEIFEAQQRGGGRMGGGGGGLDGGLLSLTDRGAEEAKLAYLRNLMVNYLSSDSAVREHMEGAIGTVLKFSPEDIAKIEKRKESDGTWFG